MKNRALQNLVALCIAAAAIAMGCDGQRSCPSDVTCADLIENTCGASGECSNSQSCVAAKRLQADGDQSACEAAWCSLGESYRECE